jgi:hypothetical protein
VRCAVLEALGNSAFDPLNRRRYLQSPGLMQLLVEMANPVRDARQVPTDTALHDAAPAAGSGARKQPVAGLGTEIPELSDVQKHAIRLLAILGEAQAPEGAVSSPQEQLRQLQLQG